MYLCEYLPRLGQVTIFLDTEDTVNKIKSLKFESNTLYVQNSSLHPIVLPDLHSGSTDPSKTLPQLQIKSILHNETELVIRINATASQITSSGSSFMSLSSACQLWSVKDLLDKTPKSGTKVNKFLFLCASCDSEIFDSVNYKFGEMPLEFWHELMDFWHCHKPHEDHHNQNEKNYNGKLVPRPDFIYIGASYLLMKSSTSVCHNCGCELGEIDLANDIAKFHKWNLKLAYANKVESFSPHLFVYHTVLDRINSAGLRKFSVSQLGSNSCIIIWISAVGLDICLNGIRHSAALKLLYKDGDIKPDDDVLEVPSLVLTSFKNHLYEVNINLPQKSCTMEMVEQGEKRLFKVAYLFPE